MLQRRAALKLTGYIASFVCLCEWVRTSSAMTSTRHSTRASQPPLSLAEEQAAVALSQLEQRDLALALRLSLSSSWDSDDEDAEPVNEAEEEDAWEQEEEKEEEPATERDDGQWSKELHNIDIPLPRLRLLQNRPPRADSTPMQLLQLFLPQQLMDEFAAHTNAAAPRDWPPTTGAELYAFIGAHVFIGIDRLPRTEMYWSQTYTHPLITSAFTRDRFKQLLRYFRVVAAPVAAAPRHPIPHIRALADRLNQSFASHFTPTQHLTLDEAIVAFKGRSSIKQYIPSKPHKWGYKIYCLASEDYLLHLEIYEGKEAKPSESGATYDTVIRMIQPYQNQQLVLFTDSWFTSPTLMSALKDRGVRLCGSVRSNRKGMPKIPSDAINVLGRGEWIQRQKDDMCLAVWKDRKVMRVLYNHVSPRSTATLQRWSEAGEKVSIGCPTAIHDYFYHARSVDVLSQLHYSYLLGRKARRVWPRLAWWLLDMCILNAYQLWSMNQQTGRQLPFREQLMHELLKQHQPERRVVQAAGPQHLANALAKDHYLEHIDMRRDCVVCSQRPARRVQTRSACHACKVHLCMGECFRWYHA
jgi:hypothetical protein